MDVGDLVPLQCRNILGEFAPHKEIVCIGNVKGLGYQSTFVLLLTTIQPTALYHVTTVRPPVLIFMVYASLN